MVDEPVRGRLPDPSFYSRPGIEQARALLYDEAPAPPLSRLMGFRTVPVSGSPTDRHKLKGIDGEWQLFALS